MTTTKTSATATTATQDPIRRCPSCSGSRFRSGSSPRGVVFRCTSCGTSWRVELGHLTVCHEPVRYDSA